MKYLFIVLLNLALLANLCWAGDKLQLQDENDKINYSVGYQVGGDLKKQGVDLKAALVAKGIEDAMGDTATPLLNAEAMADILMEFKKKIDALQQQERRLTAERYRGEGRSFLAANAKKDGVITLPSGLQYTVLQEGSGKTPKLNDSITVKYRGTLINGKEFDSSFRDKKPLTIRFNSVIPGWQEALSLMKEGSKWNIVLPSDLAFGERGPLADKVVIYEVELVAVQPAQAK